MSKSRLRHAAGMLKYRVLDCWPYKFKERQAAKLREQFWLQAFQLPPLPAPNQMGAEIHMFCGKKYLDMGIWASWSILRFMKNAVLYVHSDGTLDKEDIAAWKRVISGLVIVAKTESDEKVALRIRQRFPLLYEWRCTNWWGPGLVDMHLFGELDRFVVMDSDVLCFRDPVELRASLMLEKPVCTWNRDVRSCYSESIEVLNSVTGLKLPEAFNAGFQLTPRFGSEDFKHLERMISLLKADGRIDTNHWWSSQTYYAMCAAKCPESHALSETYAATLGRTSDDVVVRHYVGIPRVRPRYFTEGVPKVLADL